MIPLVWFHLLAGISIAYSRWWLIPLGCGHMWCWLWSAVWVLVLGFISAVPVHQIIWHLYLWVHMCWLFAGWLFLAVLVQLVWDKHLKRSDFPENVVAIISVNFPEKPG